MERKVSNFKSQISNSNSSRSLHGFTLVELLVVITILGVLMGLLLPAVNSVRESMRRAQCKNSLKQIGDAGQQHLAAQGHFPSSGWGWTWNGDPDHGFGARQPGGWIYNLLPYLGLDMIHDVGKGLSANAKYTALAEAETAVIPLLICPTRRKIMAYPCPYPASNAASVSVCSKTDYAANGGSVVFVGGGPNEGSGCFAIYPHCTWSNSDQALTAFNGVSGERSEVQVGQIVDGLSNVFFAGEKSLDPPLYYTGTDGADNSSALEGNDWDVNRWVNKAPQRDTPGVDFYWGYGSAHAAGVHFVFCDGHVQMLNFQINPATYQSLGVRNDGTVSENY